MAVDSLPTERLSAAVDDALGTDVERTVQDTTDGYRLVVSDRELTISRREGPAETVHWVVSLEADGATVGKYGPFESSTALFDQLRTVLTSDVFYTVCCDG